METLDSTMLGCIIPSGDFYNSCTDINYEPYHSSDKYVPIMCKLTADCDSFSDYRPDVHNEVYLPQNTAFMNLNNVNGILSYGTSPLNINAATTDSESFDQALKELGSVDYKAIAKANNEIVKQGTELAIKTALKANEYRMENGLALVAINPEDVPLLITAPTNFIQAAYEFKSCSQLAGSYLKSCSTETFEYKSSDQKLRNTELCEIKVDCLKIDGESKVYTSTVYSNINEKAATETVQFLENCNGSIVIGNLDDQCNDLDEINVQSKSANGRTGRITRS